MGKARLQATEADLYRAARAWVARMEEEPSLPPRLAAYDPGALAFPARLTQAAAAWDDAAVAARAAGSVLAAERARRDTLVRQAQVWARKVRLLLDQSTTDPLAREMSALTSFRGYAVPAARALHALLERLRPGRSPSSTGDASLSPSGDALERAPCGSPPVALPRRIAIPMEMVEQGEAVVGALVQSSGAVAALQDEARRQARHRLALSQALVGVMTAVLAAWDALTLDDPTTQPPPQVVRRRRRAAKDETPEGQNEP